MKTKHNHLVTAGVLLLATALAGVAARAVGRSTVLPAAANGRTTFAAPATGRVSFTGQLDRTAVLRGEDGLVRMELVIAAGEVANTESVRRPTDVVIILDRSGSMTGDKIEHARAAVRELMGQLGAQDRFALIAYSDDAVVSVPLSFVGDHAREAWADTVAGILPNGSTNMSSGLDLAIDLIERARAGGRVPHVILISDGLANQGDASFEGLARRARRAARGEYMLSTVGVGSDFNEYLMTALADAGTGNYYCLQHSADLGSVFAREFDAARTTVATGLAVRIEPGRGVRVVDAAGYPLEPAGDAMIFRPGSLFAGQMRRVWVTLAAPNDTPGEYDLGRFSVSYGEGRDRTTLSFPEVPRIACVQGEEQFYSHVDVGAWTRSVVVDAYNKMQEEVARNVAAGRRDEALQKLHEFKDETSAMNARLQSAPVAAQIHSLDKLEADVAAAFEGENQRGRQNELSKSASGSAVDARRAGSKK
jgi:Ca-activated chloride channel family protein